MNRPSASVTAVCDPCGPVTVTVTPGIGRPCGSWIRPLTAPVVSCAKTALTAAHIGVQLLAAHFQEQHLFNAGAAIEETLAIKELPHVLR